MIERPRKALTRRGWILAAAQAAVLVLVVTPRTGSSYPLDGEKRTGIRRLQGYSNAQKDPGRRTVKLSPGALLGTDDIRLSLAGLNESFDLADAPRDPALQAAIESIFAGRDPSYAVTVVDVTDPAHIAWASLRDDRSSVPESVGKVLVMVALFDALKRAFPDPAVRERVLRETMVEATDWAVGDSHRVPHFDDLTGRNREAPIARGERFSLAEWVDHMVSPSANAGGSTVWKEAILIRQFGTEYPVSPEREAEFWKVTAKAKLTELSLAVICDPLAAAGIDTGKLRQATLYTRGGAKRIPGARSYATPHELARLLLRLEQGRLVDAWSSLEMKRYLYFTRKRYRYAYAPELAGSAVYFKSGSHYKCAPEPGFQCAKYKGNVQNVMNSVAIVETPAERGPEQKRYIVALMSNVLRKNSAWDHSRLGAAIDQAVRTRAATRVTREEGQAPASEVSASGRSE